MGAFSALNGVAGAYAENLPDIFVSGGYNTNDERQITLYIIPLELTTFRISMKFLDRSHAQLSEF